MTWARNLGWWRYCGGDIRFPSTGLPLYPWIPSLSGLLSQLDQGQGSGGVVQSLLTKTAMAIAHLSSPGFYSLLFVVMTAS